MSRSRLHSATIGIVSALLFAGLAWFDSSLLSSGMLQGGTIAEGDGAITRGVLTLAAGLLLFFIARGGGSRPQIEAAWWERDLRRVAWALPLASVLLFIADPKSFQRLTRSDFLEKASSVLLIGSAACFLWLVLRLILKRPRPHKLLGLGAVGLAGLFLFLGLSQPWVARALAIEVPELTQALSPQDGERSSIISTFQVAYYFGAFVFLVALPFVHERSNLLARFRHAEVWIPTRTTTFVAAPAFAFNAISWNLASTQIAFWLTLLVLVYYACKSWTAAGPRQDRAFSGIMLLIFVSVQVAFWALSDREPRGNGLHEYKELIIALGFLIYALITFRRIRVNVGLPVRESFLRSPYGVMACLFLLTTLYAGSSSIMSASEIPALMYAKQFAEPDFLPGDWGLTHPRYPEVPFQILIYPLVRLFPLVVVSIVSRLAGYLFVSVGLALIARRMGLNALGACVAIFAYLSMGQSFFPEVEWIFGGTESKVFAYGFLFLGLHALLDRRILLAALLAGCATTMHVGVGALGSLALGLTVLSERLGSRRERLWGLAMWSAAGSVGIYSALTFLSASASDAWGDVERILVHFRDAKHINPGYWISRTNQYTLFLAAALVLLLVTAGKYHSRRTESKIVARFVLWGLLPYACWLLVVGFDFTDRVLIFFPFQLAGTLVLLFGLMLAVPVLLRKLAFSWLVPAVAIGCFFFSTIRFVEGVQDLRAFPEGVARRNNKRSQAIYDVGHWIRENTEPGALLLTAPDREEISYLARRPLVVSFHCVPWDKIHFTEWYRRIVDFGGGNEPIWQGSRTLYGISNRFRKMSREQYLELAREYGAKYLLTRSDRSLNLPLLYENDRYAVFRLDERALALPEAPPEKE